MVSFSLEVSLKNTKVIGFFKPNRRRIVLILVCGVILVTGLLLPEQLIIPVRGAAPKDWNPKSSWYEPWGVSGVHKGIDIFAPKETPVLAPTYGVVIYRGEIELGGNVLFILGPKWRVHFFGHLNKSKVSVAAARRVSRETSSIYNRAASAQRFRWSR